MENEQLLHYGHAYQLSVRVNVEMIDVHAHVLCKTITKRSKDIEMIVETKGNINFLLAATVSHFMRKTRCH